VTVSESVIDPYVGHLVDARYLVRERLASGGMATVYRATDRRLGRDVALKIMNPEFIGGSASGDFAARFRREARAAARLTHPGMVRVYDQGTDGDITYLTMEYVSGPNLREYLAQTGTISVGESLNIVDRILDALGAAHRQGLVHRDIKPENVLMDDDNLPKLGDFGLTRAATEVTSTSTGTVLGTVAYLAPEVVKQGTSDARADVYAIGVLLFEMVTGRQPFTGSSAIEVAARHVHEDVPAPSSHVAWLPPEFDTLVERLTARDPEHRPFDANEALALVRQTRSMIDEPTLARRAEPPTGSQAIMQGSRSTVMLERTPTGATVALPIGLGEGPEDEFEDFGSYVPPRPARKPRLASWIVATTAAALVITVLGFWWFTTIGPGAYSRVPTLAGMTVQEAKTALETEGLGASFIQGFSDDVAAGLVVSTDPLEGHTVAKAGTVIVTVSRGPQMTQIPELVGVLEADALASLADGGFPKPTTTRGYSDTVPVGEIVSSAPVEGETVRHDTVIALVISDGPAPITFPDVRGSTEADATARLQTEFGLEVFVEHGRTMENVSVGQIFDQDPDSGVAGHRTDSITIWVSDGKPLVEVPDFTMNTPQYATQRAESLGLKVTLQKKWPWSTQNYIIDQDIAPRTEVEVGSTIVLTYN
jgi:eukaryotic-like serine/threonine-protein kinase